MCSQALYTAHRAPLKAQQSALGTGCPTAGPAAAAALPNQAEGSTMDAERLPRLPPAAAGEDCAARDAVARFARLQAAHRPVSAACVCEQRAVAAARHSPGCPKAPPPDRRTCRRIQLQSGARPSARPCPPPRCGWAPRWPPRAPRSACASPSRAAAAGARQRCCQRPRCIPHTPRPVPCRPPASPAAWQPPLPPWTPASPWQASVEHPGGLPAAGCGGCGRLCAALQPR